MKFGNWNVTENTIEWTGDSLQQYVIEQNELLAIEPSGEFAGLYTAILEATDEDWLTVDDLYDLNYAFVYSAAHGDGDFNYETFDATVAKIFELLDLEDDEQVS